jgi:IS1 family transposase
VVSAPKNRLARALIAPAPVSLQHIRVSGRAKAGKLYCRSVRSAEQVTGLTMNALPFQKHTEIIAGLTEGLSIRSVARLCGVERNTIGRLALRVGQGCESLHDRTMRDLQVGVIECDEQWDYVAKKQKRVRQDDPAEMGDTWLFIAMAASQKAIISYTVGKRTQENTYALALDLKARIVNRPQITSDGYAPYIGAISNAFSTNVDYAVLVKQYVGDSNLPDAAHRYSPGHVSGVERTVIRGRPDPDKISTSYVERFNLSTRMQMKRFARLSNGFSKKLENHRAAIALWIAYYNFCRVHETLRMTPAMALGVTDHIWTIGELIAAALEPTDAPPLPKEPETTLRPGTRRFRLIVGRGGKGSNKPRG